MAIKNFNFGNVSIFFDKLKDNKYFCTGCPKSALRGGKTKFVKFFHRGIAMSSWTVRICKHNNVFQQSEYLV